MPGSLASRLESMAPHDLDPFLIAHRVGGGEFDMAGKYSPAAVRDQMNRAVAIIERAIHFGVLRLQDKLLIKGSGAAAVSAAMRAIERGVSLVALSGREEFFSRQRRSGRIIDPVEYDWPAEGWLQGLLPSERVPLPYSRGRAKDVVVRQWDPMWTDFLAKHEGDRLRVFASSEAAVTTAGPFDRVFDCTGPGEERTTVGAYQWYGFWSNDILELPNLRFEDRRPTVLISGGGDGALQDFLRILFPGMSPRDIYLGLQLSDAERLKVEWQILNAEDRARRAWVWSADSQIDCGVLSQLHQAHRAVASEMLSQRGVQSALEVLLDRRTTDLDRIWLAHECDHFSPCYAFNRFLVLLVNEYCKTIPRVGSRLLGGRRLTRVSGEKAHTCNGEIEDCLAFPHRAHFDPWLCVEGPRKAATPIPDPDAFDVIVVRHGLTGEAKRLSRQALPYELPAMP